MNDHMITYTSLSYSTLLIHEKSRLLPDDRATDEGTLVHLAPNNLLYHWISIMRAAYIWPAAAMEP